MKGAEGREKVPFSRLLEPVYRLINTLFKFEDLVSIHEQLGLVASSSFAQEHPLYQPCQIESILYITALPNDGVM